MDYLLYILSNFVNVASQVYNIAPVYLNDSVPYSNHIPALVPVAELYHSGWNDCFCKLHSFISLIHARKCVFGDQEAKAETVASEQLQVRSLKQSTGGKVGLAFVLGAVCKKQLRSQLGPFLPSFKNSFPPTQLGLCIS
jgi:hypothetical protein